MEESHDDAGNSESNEYSEGSTYLDSLDSKVLEESAEQSGSDAEKSGYNERRAADAANYCVIHGSG